MITDPDDLVGVLITDHPELDEPRRFEAMPGELEQLGKLAIAGVRLEVTVPGDEEPTRYILTANNFNKLATKRPMEEVLADARPVAPPTPTRRSHNKTANGEALRTFNSLENAGLPHQGKVSAEEARLVRENLEVVNANRATQKLTPIDPANPMDAKRYGFQTSEAGN